MKNWIVVTSIILILAIGIIAVVYSKNKNNPSDQTSTVATENQNTQPDYFDENASVMYFYSELCSWCKKQAEILKELAAEGYRVKPMDVKAHPEYWEQYQIKGTPTFVGKNGDKAVGFQTKDKLKEFLDKHRE